MATYNKRGEKEGKQAQESESMGEKMNLNNYLEVVGNMRLYQWTAILTQGLLAVVFAQQVMIIVFNHADQGFRCTDGEQQNLTTASSTCNSESDENCTIYDNQCTITYQSESGDGNVTKNCEQFEFDTTIYASSVIAEFNLICEKQYLATVLDTAWMISEVIGSLLGAYICDRVGRKVAIIICMFNLGIFGSILAASQNETMYFVFRCLTGAVSSVGFVSILTLLLETTAPTKRTHAVNLLWILFAIGAMTLPLLAYAIGNWRYLQLCASITILPIAIASIWLVDESPHWLIVHGKKEKALKVLQKIARWNRVNPPSVSAEDLVAIHDNMLEMTGNCGEGMTVKFSEHSNDDLTENCCLIWKHTLVLSRVVIFSFGWIVCNFGYYILSFGVGQLPGSVYITSVIMSAVEVLAYVVCFGVVWIGRKAFTVGLFLAAGVAEVISVVIIEFAKESIIAVTVLSVLGKFFISATWQVMYFWSSESIPTTHRAVLIAVMMVVGRAGSIVAPVMLDLEKYTEVERKDLILPIVYIILMIGAGLLHLIPPETNGCKFPANYEAANVHRFKRVDDKKYTSRREKLEEADDFLPNSNVSHTKV